jgi:hypothetical protein
VDVSDINIDTDGPRLFGRSTFVQGKLSHAIRVSYAEIGLSYTDEQFRHFDLSHIGAVKLSLKLILCLLIIRKADPSGRGDQDVSLQPLAC